MNVKYVNLPLQYKSLESKITLAVCRVLESGNYILGTELKKCEESLAKYCQSQYAIGVANGTDALILALRALDIKDRDEVITAPNSFIATAGAIVAAGARPRFVDVGEDYNINPELIESAINEKTRAIMPVHLTGRPADMNAILDIARKHNLVVIEDAAQAIGALYYGKRVGSLGDIGCFSLHPLKNLNAAGDGGFITLNNEDLYKKIVKIRNHGLKNRDEAEHFGLNSRLDEIQASIINIKLDYIEKWNDVCRKHASRYREGLLEIVKTPNEWAYERQVYHTFIIQADKRDELQSYLLKNGIETKIHYPIPIHLQPAARNLGYKAGDFPVAEEQAQRILSLPIYPELTHDEVEEVIRGVKGFYGSM